MELIKYITNRTPSIIKNGITDLIPLNIKKDKKEKFIDVLEPINAWPSDKNVTYKTTKPYDTGIVSLLIRSDPSGLSSDWYRYGINLNEATNATQIFLRSLGTISNYGVVAIRETFARDALPTGYLNPETHYDEYGVGIMWFWYRCDAEMNLGSGGNAYNYLDFAIGSPPFVKELYFVAGRGSAQTGPPAGKYWYWGVNANDGQSDYSINIYYRKYHQNMFEWIMDDPNRLRFNLCSDYIKAGNINLINSLAERIINNPSLVQYPVCNDMVLNNPAKFIGDLSRNPELFKYNTFKQLALNAMTLPANPDGTYEWGSRTDLDKAVGTKHIKHPNYSLTSYCAKYPDDNFCSCVNSPLIDNYPQVFDLKCKTNPSAYRTLDMKEKNITLNLQICNQIASIEGANNVIELQQQQTCQTITNDAEQESGLVLSMKQSAGNALMAGNNKLSIYKQTLEPYSKTTELVASIQNESDMNIRSTKLTQIIDYSTQIINLFVVAIARAREEATHWKTAQLLVQAILTKNYANQYSTTEYQDFANMYKLNVDNATKDATDYTQQMNDLQNIKIPSYKSQIAEIDRTIQAQTQTEADRKAQAEADLKALEKAKEEARLKAEADAKALAEAQAETKKQSQYILIFIILIIIFVIVFVIVRMLKKQKRIPIVKF